MPPYKPSLSNSRRRLTEEPEPNFYFPSSQAPGARSSFSSWSGPARVTADFMALEDIMARRDERNTKLAQNAAQRRDLEMQERLRPTVEGRMQVENELGTAKAQSGLNLNPFTEDAALAKTQLDAEQARVGLQSLPEDEIARGVERDARMRALATVDPSAARLQRISKDPEDAFAYEHFLDSAPPELKKPEERQRYAYNQSLGLVRDREAVEAFRAAVMDGEMEAGELDKLLEPVVVNGIRLGHRVRNDPKAHAAADVAVNDHKFRKERQRLAVENRQAERLGRDSTVRGIDKLLNEANDTLRIDPTNKEALEAKAKWAKRLAELLEKDYETPSASPVAPAVAPGKSAPAKPAARSAVDAAFDR